MFGESCCYKESGNGIPCVKEDGWTRLMLKRVLVLMLMLIATPIQCCCQGARTSAPGMSLRNQNQVVYFLSQPINFSYLPTIHPESIPFVNMEHILGTGTGSNTIAKR